MKWTPQFMDQASARPNLRAYLLALGLAFIAFSLRALFDPALGYVQPFAFFYLSVALTAWWAGFGPAVFASVLGLLAGVFFFLEPRLSFRLPNLIPMLTYIIVSGCFIALLRYASRSAAAAVENARRTRVVEEEVVQQNAVLRGLAESVPEGIFIVSPDAKALYMNERFKEIWRFPAEVLNSGSDEAALAWAAQQTVDPTAFRDGVLRAYREGRTEHAEVQFKDGRVFERFGARLFHNDVHYGWVWTFREITDSKKAEAALRNSEERFELISEATNDAVWDWDLTTSTLWWNEGIERLFGYKAEAIKPTIDWWQEHIHPADCERVTRSIRSVIDGGGNEWHEEYRYQRADGTYTHVMDRGYVVHDDTGKPVRMVGGMKDISERKQAEARLQESEARFRVMFESAPLGAFVIEPETQRIVDCNEGAIRLLGYTRDELCRLHVQDFDARLSSGEMQSINRRIVEDGQNFSAETVHRTKNGELRDVFVSVAPLTINNKIFNFAAAIDITDRKRADEALSAARRQLRRYADDLEKTVAERTAQLTETVHELESFSYSLSHDMRAPLRAMRSFSQILEADYGPQLDDEAKSHLHKIATAAGRLDRLIQDVLNYSKIIRERVTLHPVCTTSLLQQLLHESPALQAPLADIQVETPLMAVTGHEAYLMQVLSNVLYNAVKFVPGGRIPRVRIWTTLVGSQVRLHVQDNGIGIPIEAQKRIFGMFERLHTEKEYEGTGIGLAIARKAVERMGGRIGVESQPGNGSTFWLELPAAPPAQA